MTTTYNDAHLQFGIDEIYIHPNLDYNLLKKLQRRAEITLDCTDRIIQKNVTCDIVLIFHKRCPSQNLIYRFLEKLHKSSPEASQDFQNLHTLLNVDELFDAISTQKFVLVTPKDISTE